MRSIGLRGVYSAKGSTKTTLFTVAGKKHKIKIKSLFWGGNFNGYNYWIDESKKKNYCNRLTRKEVVEIARKHMERIAQR